jgi:hypothetical protein
MKKMFNEGNQIHNFLSSSGSGTVINYGSGSSSNFSTSYGSSSGSGSTTLKNSKKNLDSYHFVTLFDFLSLKNDVNIPSKSNKQKKLC